MRRAPTTSTWSPSASTIPQQNNSNQVGTRDQVDEWDKFTVPVGANGEVFVAGDTQLTVFGLLH